MPESSLQEGLLSNAHYAQPTGTGSLGEDIHTDSLVAPVDGQPDAPAGICKANFTRLKGVVVRQRSNMTEMLLQAAGIEYEGQNRYSISALPENMEVGKSQSDQRRWKPTNQEMLQLPKILEAREESSFCTRCCYFACGIGNMRPFNMKFFEPDLAPPDQGDTNVFSAAQPPQGEQPDIAFWLKREGLRCGACCGKCCAPELNLYKNGQPIGQVIQSFDPWCSRCIYCCCMCTIFLDVNTVPDPTIFPTAGSELQNRYSIKHSLCCCGGHNNTFGATCCKSDVIVDILDPMGVVVGNMQKTYGPGPGQDGNCCDTGFCRMCGKYSNWLIQFPNQSTDRDRAALLGSVFEVDFQYYEKKGKSKENQ